MGKNDQDISKKLTVVLLVVILILSELLIFYNAKHKSGYHVDELWSFAHSNSTDGGFLYPLNRSGELFDNDDFIYNNWTEPEKFWNYLTVQENEAFNYSDISNNLSKDVHPPLYYILLHTISSFFPEVFSKWLGIIPNMILFGFVLIVLNKLAVLLFKSRGKALLVCALFGFSIAAVNMTLFIRSYLFLTFFTLLFVFETSKLLLENKPNAFRLIRIFLYTILGLLTHYYFIIFSILLAILESFYLKVKEQNKQLILLISINLLAVFLTFMLWPTIITHLFLSTRGVQAYQRALLAGMKVILGIFAFMYVATLVLLIRRVILRKRNKEVPTIRKALINANRVLQAKILIPSTETILFIIILLSTLFTVLVIIIISPNMGIYSDRYYFNLMPLAFLLGTKLVSSILSKCKVKTRKSKVVAAILIMITLSSHLILNSAYAFPDNENRGQLDSDIQDSVCLVFPYYDFMIHNFSDVFFTTERVFAAREISDPSVKNAFADLEGAKKVTVIIDDRIPQTTGESILLEDQTGYPLQFQYLARHGTVFYRVYALDKYP
jgi:hypothetical protein